MIYLKALNAQDSEEEYRFFQSIHSENGFMNDYEGMSLILISFCGMISALLVSLKFAIISMISYAKAAVISDMGFYHRSGTRDTVAKDWL